MKWVTNITLIFLAAGCMESIAPGEEALSGLTADKGYVGCKSATALSASEIQVEFDFPKDAVEISVHRDGFPVGSFTSPEVTNFVDENLTEGKKYKYSCVAKFDDGKTKKGSDVEETTIAVNPPVFNGITSASSVSPTSVVVTWPAATGGAKVSYFQVFATRGPSVDFSTPKTTVETNNYSFVVSNLADEMNYTFAVRACNASDICDSNTKEVNLTTTDKGAPTSNGISSLSLINGVLEISVPWSEGDGAVAKRNVYRSTTNDVSSILSNRILSDLVDDVYEPEEIIIDSTLLEGTTYYYIVRDEDPSGAENTNTVIQTVSVGDLTPPNSFSGLKSVATSNPAETAVTLTWDTIDHQPAVASGASYYLIYQSEASHPASAANACESGTLIQTLNASDFTPNTTNVTYDVIGLSSRRKYNFCVKAQDAALNISNTAVNRAITMPDLTSPSFDGVQGLVYDGALDKFTVTWNAATSSLNDQYNYRVQIWKNTTTPTGGQITTKTYLHATNSTGAEFSTSDFSYVDGDTVYVVVNACDDAFSSGVGYNSGDNCTSYALTEYKFKELSDTTAPNPWGGISSASNLAQGLIQVNWSLPADKSDFSSFKFYHVEETSSGVYSKQLLDQASCLSGDCVSNPKTTHVLSVPRHRHTYRIHVSAVDASNNETDVLTNNDMLSTYSIQSLDTTAPTFNSSLSLNVNASDDAVEVQWLTAIDDQYGQDTYTSVNRIYYSVYRKSGVTTYESGDYVSGVPDETKSNIDKVASGLTALEFDDTLSALTQGQTYHYTVCAQDESSNTTCDQIQSVTISDNIAPLLTISIDEETNVSSWGLDIIADDGPKDPTTVTVRAWRKFSDDPSDFPGTSGAQFGSAKNGTGTIGSPTEFLFSTDDVTNDSAGTNHYANYTIQATDAAGNIATENYSYLVRAPQFKTSVILAQECDEDEVKCEAALTGESDWNKELKNGQGLSSGAAGTTVYTYTPPAHGSVGDCYALDGTLLSDRDCSYTQTTTHFNGADSYVMCAKDNVITAEPGSYPNSCKTVNLTINPVDDEPELAQNTFTYMIVKGGTIDVPVKTGLIDHDNVGETFTVTDVRVLTSGKSFAQFNTDGEILTVGFSHFYYTNKGQSNTGVIEFEYDVSDGTTTVTQTSTLKIYDTYTWTGNGGDNKISTGANWCGSLSSNVDGVCQGAPGAPVNHLRFEPSLCETNCTNPTITVDQDLTNIRSFFLMENFGNVVFNSGTKFEMQDCNFNRFIVLEGSSVDMSQAGPSKFHEVKIADTASFTAPASMTMSCLAGVSNPTASATYIGNGFSHNNGKVNVLGSFKVPVGSTTQFYDFEVQGASSSSEVSVSSSTPKIVLNDLNVLNGKLKLSGGDDKIIVGGDVTFGYTDSSNYGDVVSNGHTKLVMTGVNKVITVPSDAVRLGFDLGIDGPGASISTAGSTDVKLSGLSIWDGTFTAPSGELDIADYGVRVITDTGGSPAFIHNNGIVTFSGRNTVTGEINFRFDIPVDFYNFKVATGWASSSTLNLEGEFSVLNHYYHQNLHYGGYQWRTKNSKTTDRIKLHGDITVDTVYNYSPEGVSFDIVGSGNQDLVMLGDNNSYLTNLNITKPSGTLRLFGNIRIYGDFRYNSGTIDWNGLDLNWYSNSGVTAVGDFNGLSVNNLNIIRGYHKHFDLVSDVNVLGDLVTSGHHNPGIISGTGTFNVEGDLNLTTSGKNFGEKLNFTGGTDQFITSNDNLAADILINKPSGTLYLNSNVNTTGDVQLDQGVFDHNSYSLTSGKFTHESGTTVHGGANYSGIVIDNGGTWNP